MPKTTTPKPRPAPRDRVLDALDSLDAFLADPPDGWELRALVGLGREPAWEPR